MYLSDVCTCFPFSLASLFLLLVVLLFLASVLIRLFWSKEPHHERSSLARHPHLSPARAANSFHSSFQFVHTPRCPSQTKASDLFRLHTSRTVYISTPRSEKMAEGSTEHLSRVLSVTGTKPSASQSLYENVFATASSTILNPNRDLLLLVTLTSGDVFPQRLGPRFLRQDFYSYNVSLAYLP